MFYRIHAEDEADLGEAVYGFYVQPADDILLSVGAAEADARAARGIAHGGGGLRTYNRLERAIKNVVPLYGWNPAGTGIVRSAAGLALERRAVLDALANEASRGSS